MKYLLFFLLFIPMAIQAQKGSYTLVLDYYPSFLEPGQIKVIHRKDSTGIQLIVFTDPGKSALMTNTYLPLKPEDLKSLDGFLKTYGFKTSGATDTIGSRREFMDGDSITTYIIEQRSDAIKVFGSYTSSKTAKRFAFLTPAHNTENYKLIQELYPLLDKACTDPKQLKYLEKFKDQF